MAASSRQDKHLADITCRYDTLTENRKFHMTVPCAISYGQIQMTSRDGACHLAAQDISSEETLLKSSFVQTTLILLQGRINWLWKDIRLYMKVP